MYGGTAKDNINDHLKNSLPGNLQKDTKYAAPVPITKVSNKTDNKSISEFEIYSNRKVFFNISQQLEVLSKKLANTVMTGINTIKETKKDEKNQLLNFILYPPYKNEKNKVPIINTNQLWTLLRKSKIKYFQDMRNLLSFNL